MDRGCHRAVAIRGTGALGQGRPVCAKSNVRRVRGVCVCWCGRSIAEFYGVCESVCAGSGACKRRLARRSHLWGPAHLWAGPKMQAPPSRHPSHSLTRLTHQVLALESNLCIHSTSHEVCGGSAYSVRQASQVEGAPFALTVAGVMPGAGFVGGPVGHEPVPHKKQGDV